MPSMKLFGRRWHLATDTVPLAAIPLALLHFGLIVPFLGGYTIDSTGIDKECQRKGGVWKTFTGLLMLCVALCVIEMLIIRQGLKGGPLEERKRRPVYFLIKSEVFMWVICLAWTIYGTHTIASPTFSPECLSQEACLYADELPITCTGDPVALEGLSPSCIAVLESQQDIVPCLQDWLDMGFATRSLLQGWREGDDGVPPTPTASSAGPDLSFPPTAGQPVAEGAPPLGAVVRRGAPGADIGAASVAAPVSWAAEAGVPRTASGAGRALEEGLAGAAPWPAPAWGPALEPDTICDEVATLADEVRSGYDEYDDAYVIGGLAEITQAWNMNGLDEMPSTWLGAFDQGASGQDVPLSSMLSSFAESMGLTYSPVSEPGTGVVFFPCLNSSCQALIRSFQGCEQGDRLFVLPQPKTKQAYLAALIWSSWVALAMEILLVYLSFNSFPDLQDPKSWEGSLQSLARLCCCQGLLGAEIEEGSSQTAGAEIARTLAALFGGIDLDPTDRLLGLVLVAELQARSRRAHVRRSLEAELRTRRARGRGACPPTRAREAFCAQDDGCRPKGERGDVRELRTPGGPERARGGAHVASPGPTPGGRGDAGSPVAFPGGTHPAPAAARGARAALSPGAPTSPSEPPRSLPRCPSGLPRGDPPHNSLPRTPLEAPLDAGHFHGLLLAYRQDSLEATDAPLVPRGFGIYRFEGRDDGHARDGGLACGSSCASPFSRMMSGGTTKPQPRPPDEAKNGAPAPSGEGLTPPHPAEAPRLAPDDPHGRAVVASAVQLWRRFRDWWARELPPCDAGVEADPTAPIGRAADPGVFTDPLVPAGVVASPPPDVETGESLRGPADLEMGWSDGLGADGQSTPTAPGGWVGDDDGCTAPATPCDGLASFSSGPPGGAGNDAGLPGTPPAQAHPEAAPVARLATPHNPTAPRPRRVLPLPRLRAVARYVPMLTPAELPHHLSGRVAPREAARIYSGRLPPASLASLRRAAGVSRLAVAAYGLRSASLWTKGRARRNLCLKLGTLGAAAVRDSHLRRRVRTRNVAELCQVAGIAREDMLHVNHTNDPGGLLPYFVAVHEATRSVVISIRGSVGFKDIVTDLLTNPTDISEWIPKEGWGDASAVSHGPDGARVANGIAGGVEGAGAAGGARRPHWPEGPLLAHAGMVSSTTAILRDLWRSGVLDDLLLAQLQADCGHILAEELGGEPGAADDETPLAPPRWRSDAAEPAPRAERGDDGAGSRRDAGEGWVGADGSSGAATNPLADRGASADALSSPGRGASADTLASPRTAGPSSPVPSPSLASTPGPSRGSSMLTSLPPDLLRLLSPDHPPPRGGSARHALEIAGRAGSASVARSGGSVGGGGLRRPQDAISLMRRARTVSFASSLERTWVARDAEGAGAEAGGGSASPARPACPPTETDRAMPLAATFPASERAAGLTVGSQAAGGPGELISSGKSEEESTPTPVGRQSPAWTADPAASTPPWTSSPPLTSSAGRAERSPQARPGSRAPSQPSPARGRARHERLERIRRALVEEGYNLVVTGHSLGAAVATLLAFQLRPSFPDLECWAFCPPGGLLSWDLAVESRSFTTSVVVGKDAISRLSFSNAKRLVDELVLALARCRQPKLSIVMRRLLYRSSKLPRSVRRSGRYYDLHEIPDEAVEILSRYHAANAATNSEAGQMLEMYPPGEILFLRPFKGKAARTGSIGHRSGARASSAGSRGNAGSSSAAPSGSGSVARATRRGPGSQGSSSDPRAAGDDPARLLPRAAAIAPLDSRAGAADARGAAPAPRVCFSASSQTLATDPSVASPTPRADPSFASATPRAGSSFAPSASQADLSSASLASQVPPSSASLIRTPSSAKHLNGGVVRLPGSSATTFSSHPAPSQASEPLVARRPPRYASWDAVWVDAAVLMREGILVAPSMLSSHRTDNMGAALQGALRALGADEADARAVRNASGRFQPFQDGSGRFERYVFGRASDGDEEPAEEEEVAGGAGPPRGARPRPPGAAAPFRPGRGLRRLFARGVSDGDSSSKPSATSAV